MDNKEKQFSMSWFFRWFLDNKAITVFLVTLLLGLNLLVLSKITFIFIPIFEFAGAVMLPVIISGLLYYLLNPKLKALNQEKDEGNRKNPLESFSFKEVNNGLESFGPE